MNAGYYRQVRNSLRECVAMIIAFKAGGIAEQYMHGVLIGGIYPNYTVILTPDIHKICKDNAICMDPCFEEPSILGAVRKNYERF